MRMRPMMRSDTEEVPMEKPLMVIVSSASALLFRLNSLGILE